MSVAARRITLDPRWQSSLEEMARDHSDDPTWVAAIRRHGSERLLEHGFPRRTHEEWKYTSLSSIADGPYTRLLPREESSHFSSVPELPVVGPVITFLNGALQGGPDALGSLPQGLKVMPLSKAFSEGPESLQKILEKVPDNEHPFYALADATLGDGLFIEIAPGHSVEGVLRIVQFFDGSSAAGSSHLRHVLIAGEDANLAIVEEVHCHKDLLANIHWNFEIGAGSEVSRVRTFRSASEGSLFHGSRVEQQERSTFRDLFHCAGVPFIRNELEVALSGNHCHAELLGAYVANDKNHVDNQTLIHHSHPDCTSNEVYRGVLDGKSRGVFSGKIHVYQDAQRTDAKQSNDSLLLSREAEADTRPRLEIYADDVRCTHGATVGELDEEAIFYMRSRGISEAVARSLLVRAFLEEVLEGVEPAALKETLGDDLTAVTGTRG